MAYTFEPDGAVTKEALLDHVAGLDLGLSLGLGERLALQAALPSALTAQTPDGWQPPGLGDLRLSVPVGLVLPGRLQGFGLSLVPSLTLPTADPARLLGRGGWNAGAALAYSYDTKVWGLVANTGLEAASPLEELRGLVEDPRLLANLAASWRPKPDWALTLEGLYQPPFSSIGEAVSFGEAQAADQVAARQRVSADCLRRARLAEAEPTSVDCLDLSDPLTGADSPGELLLYLQHITDGGLFWTIGGGVGGTNGTGTPEAEAYISLGWSPKDSDADDDQEEEDITPCVDPLLTVSSVDMSCDEEDSASVTAELSESEGCTDYTYVWKNAGGGTVSSTASAQHLSPGTYTVTATYTSMNKLGTTKSKMLTETVSVGYKLAWEDLEEVAVEPDGYSLEHAGTAVEWQSARSRNKLAAGAEGWIEFDVPDDSEHGVGLGFVLPEPTGTAPLSNGWQSGTAKMGGLTGTIGLLLGGVWVESQMPTGAAIAAGDRLRPERESEDSKTTLRWWHNEIEVSSKTWTQGEKGAPEGELRALGVVYNPGDVLPQPRASFGCAVPPPFVPLRLTLDGSYHTPVGQVLRVRYEERYRDHDLSWTLYDRDHAAVAQGTTPVTHGLNWITLDLDTITATPALVVDAFYTFEIIDERGQRQMLRFRYE